MMNLIQPEPIKTVITSVHSKDWCPSVGLCHSSEKFKELIPNPKHHHRHKNSCNLFLIGKNVLENFLCLAKSN